jgi:hypothetical protein
MPRQRALLFTKSKFTIIMSVSRYPSGFFPAPRRFDNRGGGVCDATDRRRCRVQNQTKALAIENRRRRFSILSRKKKHVCVLLIMDGFFHDIVDGQWLHRSLSHTYYSIRSPYSQRVSLFFLNMLTSLHHFANLWHTS